MPTVSRNEHEELHKKVDLLSVDVSYIRGKIEAREKSNADWITRIIAALACLVAWFK